MAQFHFVQSNSSWGGSEVLWSKTALRLIEFGHNITLRLIDGPGVRENTEALRQRVNYLEWKRLYAQGLIERFAVRKHGIGYLARDLETKRQGSIVVSQGNAFDGLHLVEAAVKSGARVFTISQAVRDEQWPTAEQVEDIVKVYPQVHRHFFVSRENIEHCERQLGVSIANSEHVWNPYTVPFTPRLPWPKSDVLKFAVVGRLVPSQKGHDLLFRALSRPRWRNRQWSLGVYGEGSYETALRRFSKQLKIDDKVHFNGHVTDIQQVWRSHQALVLPSRSEGTPLSLIEASLCDRVSICTKVGGAADLIKDGITGFMAPFPEVDAIENSLESAWQARDKLESMGKEAGILARQIVPIDPIEVFARRLEKLTA